MKRAREFPLIPVINDKLYWDRKPSLASQTSELGFKRALGSKHKEQIFLAILLLDQSKA